MAKDEKNVYGDKALSAEQANAVTKQVNEFNKILAQGKKFLTAEELAKPLIDKPYRYLDNLSPFIAVTVIVPTRQDADGPVFWNRFELPHNVLNVKEMLVDSSKKEVSLDVFDPDYVFLEELCLKINSYIQRGIHLKLEIEYGWATPDSVKRAFPKTIFTDKFQISNIRCSTKDTKNGLNGLLKGGIDLLIVNTAENYSPSNILGIGSVANYFLIYDFLCLDFKDKLDLIWGNKDEKARSAFIKSYFEFIALYSGSDTSGSFSDRVNAIASKALKGFNPEILSDVDKACKSKTARGAASLLKKEFTKFEKEIKNFPDSPYAILTYIRDPKNKANQKKFLDFFTNIDLIMQNYRIHPYRIYKFLVYVFENDVLGKEEYKKIEKTDFFDMDFIDFNKDGIAGNILNVASKGMPSRNGGKTSYLECINAFYTNAYKGTNKKFMADDYKYLVKETYKRLNNTKGSTYKEYGAYFLPAKDYSLSTQSKFEQLIPEVAKKCRRKDGVVAKGKTAQTDDSHYDCQFFRATPLSAFQNLGVLELLLKSKTSSVAGVLSSAADKISGNQSMEDLLTKVKNKRHEISKILTQTNVSNTDNLGIIFCLFVHNKLTAILNDSNSVVNNILTSYSFRTRTINGQEYFNAGTQLFTEVNYPDVISMDVEYSEGARETQEAPYLTKGSDYKVIMAMRADDKISKSVKTIIDECKLLVDIQAEINNLMFKFNDVSKSSHDSVSGELAAAQTRFNNSLYGTDGKSGLKKILDKDILEKFKEQQKETKLIDNLINGSSFKTLFETVSSENIVTKKEEEKKKTDTKKVKPKPLSAQEKLNVKYEASQGDFNKIKQFVEEYQKLISNESLFPKFNLSFKDPVIFGAGTSPEAEGMAANKQMENYRRLRALDSNSIKVNLTVFGNPELKIYYGKGAAASIFLNVYNPDGTLSELAGEYALNGFEIKFTAGVYTNVLKLTKSQVKNDLLLSYIQNNDIVSIC